MKKKRLLSYCLALLLVLSACGGKTADVTPAPPELPSLPPRTEAPSPTPTPTSEPEPEYTGPLNPLTGLPMGEEWVGRRPVAIMLNNLKEAQPQLGQSQADIIYEALEEGGITRILALFQDVTGVGQIGTVRSTRPYFVRLAVGQDALLTHCGGSNQAYVII